MSPEQLWDAALGVLEVELSKAKFVTWFDKTFILNKSEGCITIGVPNAFTKTWLENKYHSHVVKALRRIAEDEVGAVIYEVSAHRPSLSDKFVVVNANAQGSSNKGVKKDEPDVSTKTAVAASSTNKSTAARMNSTAGTIRASSVAAKKICAMPSCLNPRYTFSNFVVGKKNELAHAACVAVSDSPGTVYNPLFIYGGVGLGKTHLMQAIGHAVYTRTDGQKKVLYVPCETFTNEYIELVRKGQAEEFKDKYRSVDVLMVDDIQFLAGKEGTQEAFFHTFNHLHQHNKQVVLTSDRPPRAIPTLEPRLFSRFEGGMIVDVTVPDLETRIAIIKQKCAEKGFNLSNEVAQFIASNIQNNIRELEGALNRVIAHHQINRAAPSVESARELLTSFAPTTKHHAVTARKILRSVADFFEIDEKLIVGNSRRKELVVPRQISMFLMREEINASFPNIGQELGGRDHTTAMHSCQKIKSLLDTDENIYNSVNMIKQRIYNS